MNFNLRKTSIIVAKRREKGKKTLGHLREVCFQFFQFIQFTIFNIQQEKTVENNILSADLENEKQQVIKDLKEKFKDSDDEDDDEESLDDNYDVNIGKKRKRRKRRKEGKRKRKKDRKKERNTK